MKQLPKSSFDTYGLIVTSSGNGGDSAARMGNWVVFSWVLWQINAISEADFNLVTSHFRSSAKRLMPLPGLIIRHPKTAPDCGKPGARDFACWNDWRVTSRDQTLPMLCAMYFAFMPIEFDATYKGIKRRFGLCQNGDPMGPAHWGAVMRLKGTNSKKFHFLLDIFLLLGVVVQIFKKDASDAINGLMILLISRFVQPTLVSKLAYFIASKFINYEKLFTEYCDNPNEKSVPFHEYCKPIFTYMQS